MKWRVKSRAEDGRVFETKSLSQSDDPELLQDAMEARAALIEQVQEMTSCQLSSSAYFYAIADSLDRYTNISIVKTCVNAMCHSWHLHFFLHRLLIWMMSLRSCYLKVTVKILMRYLLPK